MLFWLVMLVQHEPYPRQVNFLIDENVLTGKGANSTISYVHYFFEHHGLGETRTQVHVDNCGSQNKNSAFLWYYLWRVNNGLHSSINVPSIFIKRLENFVATEPKIWLLHLFKNLLTLLQVTDS